jgi:protein gp37
MSKQTSIEWADHSWNPLRGTLGYWHCVRVSPGCDHCYAAEMNRRLAKGPDYTAGADELRLHRPALADLAKGPAGRVFVCSMTDIGLPAARAFLPEVFAAMLAESKHTYLLLTKRPGLLAAPLRAAFGDTGPPANWWIGVTVEADGYAWRADVLRRLPASVRWISAEPLLGPLPSLDLAGIHWVVTGGESGPRHRHFHPAWASTLRERCHELGIAFLHKQNGGRTPKAGGRLLDGRTWDEYPAVMA